MTYADKPWLKSYKLGPYKLKESLAPYPKEPVFKALDDAAEKYPNKPALFFEGRSVDYKTVKSQADRLAAALARLGIEKGDRVCIFMPNCIEYIISTWGIQKAGGVVVPTSILRTDEGLLHEAAGSDSRVMICREEHLARVLGIKDRCSVEHVIVTSTEGYDCRGLSTSLPKGAYEFRKLLEESDPTPPRCKSILARIFANFPLPAARQGPPKGS